MKKFGINTIFASRDVIVDPQKIDIGKVKAEIEAGQSVEMFMPLELQKADGTMWKLPIEPLISISGKNIIVKRNVAKSTGRGTIKERWAEDDYSISIQGSFVHKDLKTYPKEDVETFRNIATQRKEIAITSALLAALNINRIVIESYSLPHSKGENVQNFTIEAVSDDMYELFIEAKNV